jgi:hypothetical protein
MICIPFHPAPTTECLPPIRPAAGRAHHFCPHCGWLRFLLHYERKVNAWFQRSSRSC